MIKKIESVKTITDIIAEKARKGTSVEIIAVRAYHKEGFVQSLFESLSGLSVESLKQIDDNGTAMAGALEVVATASITFKETESIEEACRAITSCAAGVICILGNIDTSKDYCAKMIIKREYTLLQNGAEIYYL